MPLRCVTVRGGAATVRARRKPDDKADVHATQSPKSLSSLGERLARYGFGRRPPVRSGSPRRISCVNSSSAGWTSAVDGARAARGHASRNCSIPYSPSTCSSCSEQSQAGNGWLDGGDTPAFRGVYEAAAAWSARVWWPPSGSCRARTARLRADRRAAPCRAGPRRGFLRVQRLRGRDRAAAAGATASSASPTSISMRTMVTASTMHSRTIRRDLRGPPRKRPRRSIRAPGSAEETGRGAAPGTKLNIPLPAGAGDANSCRVAAARARGTLRARLHRAAVRRRQHRRRSHHPSALTEDAHAHAARRSVRARGPAGPRAGPGLGGGGYNRAQPRARLDARGGALSRRVAPSRAGRRPSRYNRPAACRSGRAASMFSAANDD